MDKIRYLLLFLLLCINSIYVYGAVLPRIIVVLLLVILSIFTKRKAFYSIQPIVLITLCFAVSFMIGFVNNSELALGESKNLVFLYMYMLIMTYIWNQKTVFDLIFVTSILVNIAITGMAILFFMGFDLDRPYLPESNFVLQGERFGYSLTTLQSLSFFLAFNLIYFFNKRNMISLIPCVLGIINVFINDRRGLILFPAMVFVLYVLFVYKGKWKKDFLIYVPIVVLLLFGVLTYLTNLSGIDLGEQFSKAFGLVEYDSDSDGVRIQQFKALMDKFMESPILGNGIGSYAERCIRNDEFLYAYELTYVGYLMKFGLLGFLLIFGTYAAMILRLYRKNKEDLQFHAVLGGTISLLLINITNPYVNVSLLIFLTIVFVWNQKSTVVRRRSTPSYVS